jgi:hypothetical protein
MMTLGQSRKRLRASAFLSRSERATYVLDAFSPFILLKPFADRSMLDLPRARLNSQLVVIHVPEVSGTTTRLTSL